MIIDHLSLVSLSKSSPFEFYSFLIDSKKLSRETNAFLSFSVRQGKLFTLTAISAVISGLPVWKPHHLSHSIIWSLLWNLCPNLHAHNNIWSLKYPYCFHQPNPRADHCISLYNRNHIAPWNLSLFITEHRKSVTSALVPKLLSSKQLQDIAL